MYEHQHYGDDVALDAAAGRLGPDAQAAVDLLTIAIRDADAFNNSSLHPLNGALADPAAPQADLVVLTGLPALDLCSAGLLQFDMQQVPAESRAQAVGMRDQLVAAYTDVMKSELEVRSLAKVSRFLRGNSVCGPHLVLFRLLVCCMALTGCPLSLPPCATVAGPEARSGTYSA